MPTDPTHPSERDGPTSSTGLDHDLPDEDSLREAGENQAWKEFHQTNGGPDVERAKRTYQTLEGKFQNIVQQYEQAVRRVQQHRQKATNLDRTREHLAGIDEADAEDRRVMRDWPGGIATEVRPDELGDAIESVAAMRDQHEERAEQAKGQTDQYAELREVLSYALEEARAIHEKAARVDERERNGQTKGRTPQATIRDENGDAIQTLSGRRVHIGSDGSDGGDGDDSGEVN